MPCPPELYTIKEGDTLSSIAQRYLISPTNWSLIWNINSARLSSGDPNLIYPGEIIKLPRIS